MKRQRVVRGFTFRNPQGYLDWRIVHSVEAAQSNAAFASDRPYSHIQVPRDWHLAYKQGFRIVPVKLVSGSTNGAWKKYNREKDDPRG